MPHFSLLRPAARRVLSAVTLAALAAPAFGQASYNGSLYSRYGLGELVSAPSAPGLAMGGGGLALSTFAYANMQNPAALGQQFLTRFSATGAYQLLGVEDGRGTSGERSEANLGTVSLALPIRTNRVGIGVQYAPVSRVSYGAVTLGQAIGLPDAPRDTIDYEIGYEGSGGLNRIEAGVGVQVAKPLYLGATAGMTFGLLDQTRRTTFEPTDNPGYAEQNLVQSTRLVGFSARAGALLKLDSLGAPQRRLHVAATLELPTSLTGRRTTALSKPSVVNPDTVSISTEGTVRLPLSMAAGIAFYPDARWTFVGDARYEPWSNFESDFAFDGYTATQNRFVDRLRLSAGAEYIPAGGRYTTSYFQRLAYRIGGYVDQGYIGTPSGSASQAYDRRVASMGLTGGISFPALLPGTSLDLGLEVGQRGEAVTTPVPLVRERYFKLSLTANIGERWFERPRLN